MKKIKGNLPMINDIKRCYVQASITVKCPVCSKNIKFDFDDNYLNYPILGKMYGHGGYCEKCEEYYSLPIKVVKAEVEIECYVEEIRAD